MSGAGVPGPFGTDPPGGVPSIPLGGVPSMPLGGADGGDAAASAGWTSMGGGTSAASGAGPGSSDAAAAWPGASAPGGGAGGAPAAAGPASRDGSAVLSPGAAHVAPGGALHFGLALRSRFGAAGGRRPAAVAGLPFATLGRRMAPPPVSGPRAAAPGFAWRALGTAPIRQEPASPAAGSWRGPLGTTPAPSGDSDATFGGADPPLPARLPAELGMTVREPAAPFQPLPQAPVRAPQPAPSVPRRAAEGGSGESHPPSGSVPPAERAGPGESRGDAGGDAPRAMPVFPGLPERLVPGWAVGGGARSAPAAPDVGPAPAASAPYAPLGARTAVPASSPPSAAWPADAAGGGPADHAVAAGEAASIPLPDRVPQLAAAPAAGESDEVERARGQSAGTPRVEDAPALAWAAPGRVEAVGAAERGEPRGAFGGGDGAAPLAWALPAAGVSETPIAGEAPRLAWAAGSEGAAGTAGPAGAAGEPGPYAPTLLHGISLAAQAVATAAEQRETVRQARREAQEAARPAAAPTPPPPPAPDPTSDEVVRTIMRKMAAMASEERFRAGGLR